MAKVLHINPRVEPKINKVAQIFEVSATAVMNYLLEKSIDIFEGKLAEIEADLKKNPEIVKAFKLVLEQKNKPKKK